MDEKTAWDQFTRTGSVFDYLEYKSIANRQTESQGEQHVHQHGWSSDSGTEYR